MPWERTAGGYTKKGKRHGQGGFVRNAKQYEKLRGKGFTKEQAARITNSDNVSKMSQRTDRSLQGAGVAGLGVGLARTPLADAAARGATSVARRRVAHATGRLEAVQASPRAPHRHLRGYQPDGSFVSATKARRIANVDRAARLEHAGNELRSAKRVLAAVPKGRQQLARGLLAVGAAGAGATYLGSRDIAKATKREVDAAAAGTVAGAGTHLAAGHALKPRGVERRISADDNLQRIWSQHRARHGVTEAGRTGSKQWRALYRSYPKSLPGAGMQRLLSHTHAGGTGMATALGMAAVGGAVGAAAARHREPVRKGGTGHLLRLVNGATGPAVYRHSKVPPAKAKPKKPGVREGMVMWGQEQGLVGKAQWSDEKLAHRKRVGAALGTTGAIIGLSTLAAKGGKGALLRIKPTSRTAKIAEHLDAVTDHALVAGAGIGGFAGLNNSAVARQEAARVKQQKLKKGAGMDELSKAKADQAIRRRLRNVAPSTGVGSKPPVTPKVPPTGFGAKAGRIASAGMRSLKTPQGKLVALGAAGAAAGLGTAAYVAHRRKNSIGKSAFGVDHVIEIDKAFDPMKPLKAAETFSTGVGRAFGRGTAAAGAKAAIRPRAMTALAGASKNPVERAAFHTGNATKNFTAGFSRKPPSPEAKALGTHITSSTSTNPTAFKAGRLTRQYAVPAAVAGTGAYAGVKLANRNRNQFGKSAFGVEHGDIEKGLRRDAAKLVFGVPAVAAKKGAHAVERADLGGKLRAVKRSEHTRTAAKVALAGPALGVKFGGKAINEVKGKFGKSAFGVDHELEVSKARADQRRRAAARRATAPKIPPTTSSAKLGGASRFLKSPKGRLVAAGVGVGAAGVGTAAYLHHRSRVGKSAFGVEHEVSKNAGNYLGGPLTARKGERWNAYKTSAKYSIPGQVAGAGLGAGIGAAIGAAKGAKGKGALIGAMAGSAVGSQVGYHAGYRKNKKLGRFDKDPKDVSKADRRFTGERSTTPLYLPKHSEQAVKLRNLKAKPKPIAAAIRDTVRITSIGKSAFGVDHEIVKSIGYDSEADRHRRAGYAAGVLGVGAAGMATGAAHQARAAVRTGREAQKKFRHASGRAKDLAAVKTSARDAGKLVHATNVHGARAAGLALGAASLGSAAGAVIHHNKRGGRTYNGWYS